MVFRSEGRLQTALDGEFATIRRAEGPSIDEAVTSSRPDAVRPFIHAPEAGKPVWTLDQIIENFKRWGDPWEADVIQYAFPKTSSEPGFIPFTEEQMVATRLVLELLHDIVNIEFRETSDAKASGTIVFQNAQGLGEGIWGIGGGGGAAGSVTVNSDVLSGYWAGSYNLMALAHEIGHALNLPHPGEYGSAWPSYATDAPYAQDSLQYTVMSYWEAEETGAYHAGHYASTFLLHDIAALQAIYGANMTTRQGDSTYGFNITPDVNASVFDFSTNRAPVMAIWDTGGIDTLDLSRFGSPANVSLEPGSFSDIGGNTKTLAIAFGTIIENVISSYGNDTLGGNDANNLLVGGEGDDIISGGSGDDTLVSGSLDFGAVYFTYTDTLIGGAGNDTFYVDTLSDRTIEAAGGGTDLVISADRITLAANIENLQLFGSANLTGDGNELANRMTGNAGANRLRGFAGNDVLDGGEGGDTLDGGAGIDRMIGGAGNDMFYADTLSDQIVEAAGGGIDLVVSSDRLTLADNVENVLFTGTAALTGDGNGLANVMTGNAGANRLRGFAGNDVLDGGAGNDTLDGGAGVDQMIGGAGNDTFYVDTLSDRTIEAAGGGTDLVMSSDRITLAANIENLQFLGSANPTGDGNALANRMFGNAGANRLRGFDGNDILDGGAGNDTLDGGLGVDVMTGGAGDDIFHVDTLSDRIVEAAGGGTDLVVSSDRLTLAANVENVLFTGTAALTGDGNGLANVMTGNAGANRLRGFDGNDTLAGGDGADTLAGGSGRDQLDVGVDTRRDLIQVGDPAESAGAGHDRVSNVDLNGEDQFGFSLSSRPSLIRETVTGGALSSASFDRDLASAVDASRLGAFQAVLFNPAAGDQSGPGRSYLIVDANGIDGYQPGDYVLELVNATGTLTLDDFA